MTAWGDDFSKKLNRSRSFRFGNADFFEMNVLLIEEAVDFFGRVLGYFCRQPCGAGKYHMFVTLSSALPL